VRSGLRSRTGLHVMNCVRGRGKHSDAACPGIFAALPMDCPVRRLLFRLPKGVLAAGEQLHDRMAFDMAQ
jgi:hypothetical protein